MESTPPERSLTSKKNLENYAISYMGAYLNTVKKERPQHPPVLARNQFYEIEVCLMPNHCFAMLFEKAEQMNVKVSECGWDYLEGKVLSGPSHLVTVYAHEGVTVADAIARGKRDAVRDIRALEDSDISKAATQLEKILEGMTGLEQGNKSALKLGEQELAKLKPIKEAIESAGPGMDMLQMIDALKNYSSAPTASALGDRERELLQRLVNDLGDLSDVIRRVEAQDQKLEELEQGMKKSLSEFNRNIDERVSKGLAVILAASDKKIDKGFAAMAGQSKFPSDLQLPRDLEIRLDTMEKAVKAFQLQLQELVAREQTAAGLPKDIEVRLEKLDKAMEALQNQLQEQLGSRGAPDQQKSAVFDELVLAVADLKETLARTNTRIIKIEEFLSQISGPSQTGPRTRVLRQK
jgi:hypothetical protein